MIGSAVIVTKDRRTQAARCAEMLRASKRKLDVSVFDQSQDARPYPGCRFAGLEDVERYAAQLASFSGVSQGVIRFGLIGEYGGFRNAALLDTVGEWALSIDDDAEPVVSAPPEQESERLFYAHHGEKPEMWWFSDRRAWQSRFSAENDLIEKHEQLLGGTTDDGYRIPVTMTGIIGDCASVDNFVSLALEGHMRDRLMEDYETNSRTREILQAYRSQVVTRDPFLRTVCFAYDNSDTLPPFLPSGRGECGIFGQLLSLAFPTACIGHLPWAVHHVPIGRQGFDVSSPVISPSSIVAVMLSALEPMPLREIGNELRSFGELRLPQVQEFIDQIMQRASRSMIAVLEDRLRDYSEPDQWVLDASDAILRFSQPVRASEEQAAEVQRVAVMFGTLLCAWHRLCSAARALRKRSVRVSREVQSWA